MGSYSSAPRYWLYMGTELIAELSYSEGDFPWHYFHLRPLKAYARYAALFALHWRKCDYVFDDAPPLQHRAFIKIHRFIRRNWMIVWCADGCLHIWCEPFGY